MAALEVDSRQRLPRFSTLVPHFTIPWASAVQPSQTNSNCLASSTHSSLQLENATINPAELSLPTTPTNVAASATSPLPSKLCSPSPSRTGRISFAEAVEATDGYVCSTCPRSFDRIENLKSHERSHNKEKSFECSQCSRCFSRRNTLRYHEVHGHTTPASKLIPQQHSSTRFSLSAVKVLDDWLAAHRENPYPTTDQRDQLAMESGLTPKQVNTWFANARRRQLDPMARYVSSSSEDEAALLEDIRLAAESMSTLPNTYGPSSYSLLSEYSFSSPGNPFDSPWSPPQGLDFGGLSSASSVSSAFDQCPEARWSGPPRKGRKRYAGSIYSSCSSAASLASAELNQGTFSRPSVLPGASMPLAPYSMTDQFSSKASSGTQKKHKCKVCDKRFTRPSSLQTHMCAHTGEKPFMCEVEGCGRHFSVAANLRRHGKVHRNDGSEQRYNSDGAGAPLSQAESSEPGSKHGSSLEGLSMPRHVQQRPENRSSRPIATDDFGDSSFGSPSILEKNNEEVIQQLHAEEVRSQREPVPQHDVQKPTFQCTFCGMKLSEKAWRRHEESQHVPRRQWTCMPSGHPFRETIFSYAMLCLLCRKGVDDMDNHVRVCPNRASDCLARPVEQRTYQRKDHLVQHMKRFHDTELDDLEICLWEWETTQPNRQWGCGFCGEILANWNERATHIAAHFRHGMDMTAWDSSRIAFGNNGECETPLVTDFGMEVLLGDGVGQEGFEDVDAELISLSNVWGQSISDPNSMDLT